MVLSASMIVVHPGGSLRCGTEDAPFYSGTFKLYMVLNASTPISHEKSKKIVVENADDRRGLPAGSLQLHGLVRGPSWTRLAATAAAGADTVSVAGRVDWAVGDEIVVTSTDFYPSRAERRIIGAVRASTLVLTRPLTYNHTVIDELHGARRLRWAAEVGMLDRSIVVEGEQRDWGALFFGGATLELNSASTLSGVRISHCGRGVGVNCCGPPELKLPAVLCSSCTMRDSVLLGSVQDGINDKWRSYPGQLIRNIVMQVAGSSVWGGSSVVDNLALLAGEGNFPSIRASAFTGNVAAGSDGFGFQGDGAIGHQNVAHSMPWGAVWDVASLARGNLTVFRASDFGVWGSSGHGEAPMSGTSVVSRLTIADCSVGLFWASRVAYESASGTELARLVIRDSLLVGRSSANQHCEASPASGTSSLPARRRAAVGDNPIAGIVLPFFGLDIPRGKFKRKCCLQNPALSAPRGQAKQGELVLSELTLSNFFDAHCDQRAHALEANMFSFDHNPPTFLSSIDLLGTPNPVFMPPPQQSDISLKGCLTADCDGPKHTLLFDVDGSFSRTSIPWTSVLARAEQQSPFRANGRPTSYRIPAKLLYDPWPDSSVRRRLTSCDVSTALYDPACRTRERVPAEVAWAGWGTYRGVSGSYDTCELKPSWNAWECVQAIVKPARLVIESLDADTFSRSLVFTALASGGYVQLHNGGSTWGGGVGRGRRSNFYSTVGIGREYDLAIMSTNPQRLRFEMPSAVPNECVRLGLYYSNPQARR